ncbi:ribosome recycling factor [Natranaerobius thermophilus]|uniref:Ribosome-recycling factor n=1 Tax=Natranaerobius thermophilus (strain ATCC BAA-1301 / DSM 18059 / JW/NM-WN-LF) TaxID=457570 RepID=RRF_NATTJ|nr:RecName: Full=Ribosome-recycling factor; Short=RRF; AltName: Full=Ribosome-releasing factor [Natranaerobius thermophilus JW/NM-WN-LF]ACB85013.1 ribosome recycling factor [Natranaerobius thermophilus JW/NM-WN-LF]
MDSIFKDAEQKMKKALSSLKSELASLRAGRANPSILEGINVDYYGMATPLNQLANISAPEPRLLVVQPYDKSAIEDIEKAILKSDVGLTPNNDGQVIRLAVPQLTEERRNELVKIVRQKGEDTKVVVRNVRRDANDELKKLEKEKEISEDESIRGQDEIQKITDKYIKKIDEVMNAKEEEITSF